MSNQEVSYDEMEVFIQRGMEISKQLMKERARKPYSNQEKEIDRLELERKSYERQLKLYVERTANQ
jgi:hypothetical protein